MLVKCSVIMKTDEIELPNKRTTSRVVKVKSDNEISGKILVYSMMILIEKKKSFQQELTQSLNPLMTCSYFTILDTNCGSLGRPDLSFEAQRHCVKNCR